MLFSALSIACLIYFLLIVWLRFHLGRLFARRMNPPSQRYEFTIVIPFRNEESNIAKCLESLTRQEHEDFKVICIDDHSDDNSRALVDEFVNADDRFSCLSLKLDKGKKAALELGIKHCQTEWIITRDADTTSGPLNLAAINQTIDQDPTKQMWVLPVTSLEKSGFLKQFYAMEFHALVATGLATAKAGIPIMANGANLAFTQSLFNSLEGYRGNRNVSSGDDILLLQKAIKKGKQLVGVGDHPETAVDTVLPDNLRQWLAQRVRWGSKFKWHSSLANTLIAILVLLTNLARVLYLPSVLIFLYHMEPSLHHGLFMMAVSLTLWGDYLLLNRFNTHFKKEMNERAFSFSTLVYPFMLMTSVVASLVYRPKWKGRKIEV